MVYRHIKKLNLSLITGTLFFLSLTLSASDNDYIQLLKFSKFLEENHEFDRAATELERYQFLCGYKDSIQFQIGYYYLLADELEKSKVAFQSTLADPTTCFFPSALVYSALIEFRRNNPANSISYLNLLDSCKYANAERIFQGALLKTANYLYLDKWNNANNVLLDLDVMSEYESNKRQFNQLLNSGQNLPKKNALTAALFSAFLPGMGKVYVGQKIDGLFTMLLIGATSYMSYDGFHNDRPAKGWLFSGLTAVFYLGNIHGSYVSACVYNKRITNEYKLGVSIAVDNLFHLSH